LNATIYFRRHLKNLTKEEKSELEDIILSSRLNSEQAIKIFDLYILDMNNNSEKYFDREDDLLKKIIDVEEDTLLHIVDS
jgi:hypothetical protein